MTSGSSPRPRPNFQPGRDLTVMCVDACSLSIRDVGSSTVTPALVFSSMNFSLAASLPAAEIDLAFSSTAATCFACASRSSASVW